ncbi:peptidase inhibitor family I36 protein [Streptomyces anulatus]|uniref:peptidase inhibitor family I36 protein n=1 Tax=Streptomyces TaxID=1883 RepID=UPI001C5F6330|nr:peptidase inhibitor family I36 protein [Streptomyces anulatus]QYA94340.1 peptidase inhibitor family I36 protein [Streptomyces anulatus]
MKPVRALRSKAGLVAGVTLLAGVGLGAATVPAQAKALAYSCPEGDICFYTGDNGTGERCNWDGNDNDWRNGTIQCSWAADKNVRSIYNNGTSGMAVVYYSGANYETRKGCTTKGKKGNLAGTYKVRSHKWVNSC